MLSFSQRKGLKPIRTLIQVDSADIPLRNKLWNLLTDTFFKDVPDYYREGNSTTDLLKELWVEFYELRIDEIDRNPLTMVNTIKRDFIKGHWGTMYDILEFIPNHFSYTIINDRFVTEANEIFEKYLSAYRFVDKIIVDITSAQEILSIENALKDVSKYKHVQSHLNRALELLADRNAPDYRNSIKESISAVESLCSTISGNPKATLGQALAVIEKSHQLHSALKESFSKLYGWTSDASGIRHKLLDESTLGQEDAKFMLVTCSAFINYLLVKAG